MPRKKKAFKGVQYQNVKEIVDEDTKKTASKKKIPGRSPDLPRPRPTPATTRNKKELTNVEGNRIIDMKLLQQALQDAHVCQDAKLIIKECTAERKGLCSSLYLCCSKCDSQHIFFHHHFR